MKKKPLLDILLTFYKRDTMRYVGQNWKGGGFLLLAGLCAYAAIFVTYTINNNFKAAYKDFYKPAISTIPEFQISAGQFVFKDEMPIDIKHPITKANAFYIDTSTDDLETFPDNYHCYMSETQILFPYIPFPVVPSTQLWTSLVFKDLEEGKNYTGTDLIAPLDKINKWSVTLSFIASFMIIFVMELIKTLVITYIVMFMFRKGQIKKDFKMINRLCVLTYLPVLLINAGHMFFMAKVGIITLIILSFAHIIMLMTALAVNLDDEDLPPEKP